MLRIFIDFILKTALEWRVNLTVLRSKFKRIRPVWFLSCSDEVSIIAIMKPEECCRPQSRFFLCIHLHAVRESTENCVQICDFCQKFLGQPDEEPSFESIFVFSLWNIYALEKYPGVKKKNRVWGLIDKGKLNCTSNITACQLPAFHREFRIERQDEIMLSW